MELTAERGILVAILALIGTAIAHTRSRKAQVEHDKTQLYKVVLETKQIAREIATELAHLQSTHTAFREAHEEMYEKLTSISPGMLLELENKLDGYLNAINSGDVSSMEEQTRFACG